MIYRIEMTQYLLNLTLNSKLKKKCSYIYFDK